MNATQSDTAKLWADVKEKTQKQKEGFKDGMREAQEKILPCLKQLKGKSLNFSEYWKIGAEKLTEAFADHVGVLKACRKRGIKSMLDIRSVRLCVGGSLSLIYAHDFEGRTPKIDDSRDLQHAVLSAASDAFVTHDGKFTRLAARIPIDNFEVMDLRGLLQQLG